MADKKEKDTKKNKKNEEMIENLRSQVKPMLSEKTYRMANEQNKYAFAVPRSMNKLEAAKAVENIYGVKVRSANVLVRPGKLVTDWQRNKTYRRSDVKKVIVTLNDGDKIEEFFNI